MFGYFCPEDKRSFLCDKNNQKHIRIFLGVFFFIDGRRSYCIFQSTYVFVFQWLLRDLTGYEY